MERTNLSHRCLRVYLHAEEESFEISETNRRTSVPVDLLLATCREVNARKEEEGRRRSVCQSNNQS